MADFRLPDIRIPDGLDISEMPDLLRYWYLGTRARRHIALRRFHEVDVEINADRGALILDIGSAWGYNVMALRLMGHRAIGADLVIEQFRIGAEIARANAVEFPVVAGDAAWIPFESDRFHCILMVETFEHIYEEDRYQALSECHRVLRRGGRLVFSTPNYQSLVERFKRFAVKHPWLQRRLPTMCYPAGDIERHVYHPYRYHQPAPEREIQKLIEDAGFRVEKAKRFLFVLKNTPDILFPLARLAERGIERIPVLRRLAATICFVAEK